MKAFEELESKNQQKWVEGDVIKRNMTLKCIGFSPKNRCVFMRNLCDFYVFFDIYITILRCFLCVLSCVLWWHLCVFRFWLWFMYDIYVFLWHEFATFMCFMFFINFFVKAYFALELCIIKSDLYITCML